MSKRPPPDPEEIEKRFIELLDEIQRSPALPQTRRDCAAMVRCLRKQFMSRSRSGNLSQQDWRSIESALSSVVRNMPVSSPELLEFEAFSKELQNRQGTQIPDWQEFYAQRAELEQRIRRRGEEL